MDNKERKPSASEAQQKTRLRQRVPEKAPVKKKGAAQPTEIDYDYERSVQFANRGCLLAFVGVAVIGIVILLFGFFYVQGELNGNNASVEGTITVTVAPNSGGQRIGSMLEENGLIGNAGIFRFYVRLNGITGFLSGDYEVIGGSSYEELIAQLTEEPPPAETIKVTFPEGSTVYQFARICEDNGLCTVDEFLYEANNGDYSDIEFFKYIDLDPNTYMRAEGYLFPATYDFIVGDTPYNIVRTLFVEFNRRMNMGIETTAGSITPYERLEATGMSLRDMVTLASIVEEEASGYDDEMQAVAGVFSNRLFKDHPYGDFARRTMGTDVTTRYLGDFVARSYVTDYPDGYNDWTLVEIKEWALQYIPHDLFYAYYTGDEDANSREGLPAGPVSSPGWAAIKAALFPESHDYYYFVTDDYGEFRYAQTLSQHNRNVQEAWAANERKKEEEG